MQVSSESAVVLGPAEAQEWRRIQLLQTSEHDSWAGKEDDKDETHYEQEEPRKSEMSVNCSHILPKNIKGLWCFMNDQDFSLIFVVDSLLTFNLTFFQKVRFCSTSWIKELMVRSVVSSCYPSEEVPNFIADADEEHLNVLERSGSEML